MKGLPNHFGTEADIINCMKVDPVGTIIMLERLLDGRTSWSRVGDLEDDDPGITDEIHEVRVEPADPDSSYLTDPDAPMKRVQYVLQDDPLSQLFRLGLTVQGVNEYIAECERMDT